MDDGTTAQLDAVIINKLDAGHGTFLASTLYGERTLSWTFEMPGPNRDIKSELIQLPTNALKASFWIDRNDHSKGTVVREISMLRCAMDHQREARIFPVEVCPHPRGDGNGVMISDVTSRDDFHMFVKGEGQNPHAALAHLRDLAL